MLFSIDLAKLKSLILSIMRCWHYLREHLVRRGRRKNGELYKYYEEPKVMILYVRELLGIIWSVAG